MTDGDPPSELESEVRAAIAEVRREALKAAALPAVVDGVAAFLALQLGLLAYGPASLEDPLVGPVPARIVGSAVAGAVVAGAEFAWLARRPTVERFEAANPAVSEALRTARDAVESDRGGPVVRALYADVLDRLGETSSRDLVAWRRIGATLLLVTALAGGSVAYSAAGIGADPVEAETGPARSESGFGTGVSSVDPEDTDLQSGEEVLGEPTNVSAGDRNLSAPVRSGTGGQGTREPEDYDRQGYAEDVEGQDVRRAGYAGSADVEEADLIRQFTLALEDDRDGGDGERNRDRESPQRDADRDRESPQRDADRDRESPHRDEDRENLQR